MRPAKTSLRNAQPAAILSAEPFMTTRSSIIVCFQLLIHHIWPCLTMSCLKLLTVLWPDAIPPWVGEEWKLWLTAETKKLGIYLMIPCSHHQFQAWWASWVARIFQSPADLSSSISRLVRRGLYVYLADVYRFGVACYNLQKPLSTKKDLCSMYLPCFPNASVPSLSKQYTMAMSVSLICTPICRRKYYNYHYLIITLTIGGFSE